MNATCPACGVVFHPSLSPEPLRFSQNGAPYCASCSRERRDREARAARKKRRAAVRNLLLSVPPLLFSAGAAYAAHLNPDDKTLYFAAAFAFALPGFPAAVRAMERFFNFSKEWKCAGIFGKFFKVLWYLYSAVSFLLLAVGLALLLTPVVFIRNLFTIFFGSKKRTPKELSTDAQLRPVAPDLEAYAEKYAASSGTPKRR